jgi:arylsulfatase A-like enzyme
VEHSKDVYQEVLWVPLMVKNPQQSQGKIVNTLTTSADIPKLILAACGSAVTAHQGEALGRSAWPRELICENYYSRVKDLFHPLWGHRFRRVRTVLFDWPFKYIHSSDGQHELYDLEQDPAEAHNLSTKFPTQKEDLANRLTAYLEHHPRPQELPTPPPLSEEQQEKLESLGY